MLGCLAVAVILGFIHSQRQAGDSFRDDPDTSIYCGKLDRSVGVDRFPRTTGAEVESRSGADTVTGLVPRTKKGGEWISHENHSLKTNNAHKSQEKNWKKGKSNGILLEI